MSACCHSFSATRPYTANDDSIDFPTRPSYRYSIFRDEDVNEHRIMLEEWSRELEQNERNLSLKQDDLRRAHTDLYQILGLFFVFQGVIITAVAQASFLTCHNWILPFFPCLVTSIFTFVASLQKLMEIQEFTGQRRILRAQYLSYRTTIDSLSEQGTSFDIFDGQPELNCTYAEVEYCGRGFFALCSIKIWLFCRMWFISYAGAVLLLLFAFAGVTLFSTRQILCNPR